MIIKNPIYVNKVAQAKTVGLLFVGDNGQTVLPDEGKVLSSVYIQKPLQLIPSNIKEGIVIAGVFGTLRVGTYVEDTTATQNDVLYPKEFYQADGQKVQGTIPTYAGTVNVTPIEQAQTLPTQGKYVDGDITVDAIPSRYKDTTGTDATAGDILAGKKAVTGAGLITGNYTPPAAPTLITKSITANGTYNASSDNADGYSSVTVNVGSSVVSKKDVNFYDYDGTLVASYTAADFALLSAMPANPARVGLVAQGWNWALSAAKTYVASYGKLNIGQMYATASGKTEYDVEINEATGMTATLGLSGTEKDWGDGTIDTLETHTYATAGNYTIKLSGTTLPSIQGSKNVRAVRIANGVTSIGDNAFQNCYSLQSVTIPSSVTSIGNYALYNCRSLQSVTIPSGVTSIGDSALYHDGSLQSVTIPSSVTRIGDSALYNCYSLQSVTIPSSVTRIGDSAFRNCYSLQLVTIPSGVTSIGDNAFRNCYSLQSVTIPSSVTSIGNYAFASSSWLTIMTILATTPPTVSSTSFPSTVTKIYIPHGTLATYQADTNWSTYASKLVELPA